MRTKSRTNTTQTASAGFVVLLAVLCEIGVADESNIVRPILRIDEPSVSVEWAPIDGSFEHTFSYSNAGNVPLTVEVKKTSCNCLIQQFSNNHLNPGESGTLRVGIKPSRAEFSTSTVLTIVLHTNDPVEPEVLLSIKLDRKKEIQVKPRIIDFGSVAWHEKTATIDVELTLTGTEASSKITGASVTSPSIVVAAHDVEEHDEVRRETYRLVLDTTALGGPLHERLSLTLDSPLTPTLDIPIVGDIRLPSAPSPPALRFGAIQVGETVERVVDLGLHGQTSVPVLIEHGEEDLHVELYAEGDDARAWKLRGTFHPLSQRPPLNTKLAVHDKKSGERLALIPVTGYVRRVK